MNHLDWLNLTRFQKEKYLFLLPPKIQYMSLAKLHKLVDLDQLPEELGGQLPYQHKQWVKNRLVGLFQNSPICQQFNNCKLSIFHFVQRMETFGKRSQMILANLSEVRGQLERGCELQKSDGGFRMIDWMVSLGTLYRNCLANVRKVEQNGESFFLSSHSFIRFVLFSLVLNLYPSSIFLFMSNVQHGRDVSLSPSSLFILKNYLNTYLNGEEKKKRFHFIVKKEMEC